MPVSPLQNDITEVSSWSKKCGNCQYEWPTVEDRISETENAYIMSEFICIWCRNPL